MGDFGKAKGCANILSKSVMCKSILIGIELHSKQQSLKISLQHTFYGVLSFVNCFSCCYLFS